MTDQQRARRAQQRRAEAVQRDDRIRVLEATLHAVWLWSTNDGTNLEVLRSILIQADSESRIHAALDRLLKGEPHGA